MSYSVYLYDWSVNHVYKDLRMLKRNVPHLSTTSSTCPPSSSLTAISKLAAKYFIFVLRLLATMIFMFDIVELCWLWLYAVCSYYILKRFGRRKPYHFVVMCVFAYIWVVISDLSPWETIGSLGVRNFVLVKKPQSENPILNGKQQRILDGKQVVMARKGSGSWKAWFNKSLSRKIVSYWIHRVDMK